AGRLDYDSEGLVILTNDGSLQHFISDPRHKLQKVYLVQVEGIPDEDSLGRLRKGVLLKDGMTKPAEAEIMDEPRGIWPRVPPIRYRKNIPTAWLRLTIIEGRNRQVRRMTAAINHPCLRLIRIKIGQWELKGLKPGEVEGGEAPQGLAGEK
ncbi:MAG: pseudouridine synthase, partial [Thermodesulfobacteriota bacterium]